MKLNEIILMNSYVQKYTSVSNANTNISLFYEAWDFLQIVTALYINSDISGIPFSIMVTFFGYFWAENFKIKRNSKLISAFWNCSRRGLGVD